MSKRRRSGGWRTAAPSGRRWRRTHSFTDLTRKVRTLLKGTSTASAHWRGAPLRFWHGTAPPRREGAVDCPPRDGCRSKKCHERRGAVALLCGSNRYRPEHARAHALQLQTVQPAPPPPAHAVRVAQACIVSRASLSPRHGEAGRRMRRVRPRRDPNSAAVHRRRGARSGPAGLMQSAPW